MKRLTLPVLGAAAIAVGSWAALSAAPERAELHRLQAGFLPPLTIPYPSDGEGTSRAALAALGRRLFFDPLLSRDRTRSCASCHDPVKHWSDGRARALGLDGQTLARRTPTLIDVAWGRSFFWDGRAETLEAQSLGPIANPAEMGLPIPKLVRRLRAEPSYVIAFAKAFPKEGIRAETIARSLATFERGIVSDSAPFDRWLAGDKTALSAAARRGFLLFNGKGGCVKCHSGWRFSNDTFADTGVDSPDRGRGAVVGSTILDHAFKTPTLRDLTSRAPYMHDGSLPTLAAVIEHYDRGGTVHRPTSALFLKPLHLDRQEKADLIAFLQSLDSTNSHHDEEKAP